MSSKEKIKFKPGTILTQAASFSLMMLCDSFLPAVDVRQFFKTSMITQKNMRQ
jgi:hypothetical protein